MTKDSFVALVFFKDTSVPLDVSFLFPTFHVELRFSLTCCFSLLYFFRPSPTLPFRRFLGLP